MNCRMPISTSRPVTMEDIKSGKINCIIVKDFDQEIHNVLEYCNSVPTTETEGSTV